MNLVMIALMKSEVETTAGVLNVHKSDKKYSNKNACSTREKQSNRA